MLKRKLLPDLTIASFRMNAPYAECGIGFKKVGRKFGRHICGKPFLLCHDNGYRDIANFDVCMPVKKGVSTTDIKVIELAGGECLYCQHVGPYDDLKSTYQLFRDCLNQEGIEWRTPTREVYIKGPGMIFKGNPNKYITEIQVMI